MPDQATLFETFYVSAYTLSNDEQDRIYEALQSCVLCSRQDSFLASLIFLEYGQDRHELEILDRRAGGNWHVYETFGNLAQRIAAAGYRVDEFRTPGGDLGYRLMVPRSA